VFDSDLGNGVDAALALALLYGLEGKGEARLVSNSTTRSNLTSAAFADVLARFYAGPPPAAGARGFEREMPPIGMAETGSLSGDTLFWTQCWRRKRLTDCPLIRAAFIS